MKKDLLEKVFSQFRKADKAYIRMLREYATVKENNPTAADRAKGYVKSIRDTLYEGLNNLLKNESDAIIKGAKFQPVARDVAGEMRRNSELILMKSAIEGAADNQLLDLAKKYANTEYEGDFRTMIQPKIKAMVDEVGPQRVNNAMMINDILNILDEIPEAARGDVEYINTLSNDIRSLLYFDEKTFPLNIQVTEDGRILHGNCLSRNVGFDIDNADPDFNPLRDGSQEPLIVSEQLGGRTYKTVRYQFDWAKN